MITCWLNEFAVRKHLDEGSPISANAQAHFDSCPRCRGAFAVEKKLVARLQKSRGGEVETPPFLHARIMNAVNASAPRKASSLKIGLAFSFAALALGAFVITLKMRQPESQIARLEPGAPRISFASPKIETAALEQPLETEIENLKSDTRNAALALASSFLPNR